MAEVPAKIPDCALRLFPPRFLCFSLPQIYQLAKDTVVLLLECNPDVGMLLEWVIDRCYTAVSREADACFLALSSIFNVK